MKTKPDQDNLKQNKAVFRWRWKLLIFVLLMIPVLCISIFVIVLFGQDIYGTTIEAVTHYPSSTLIWSGYGVYGSGDNGAKVYYRWTPDDALAVTAYYEKYPESWRAQVSSVEKINVDNLFVCTWVGFWATDGCEMLKANLPDYGTLISFSHTYFAG